MSVLTLLKFIIYGALSLIVIPFCWICRSDFFGIVGATPWRIIFFVGIILSLWSQLVIYRYFEYKNYFESTKIEKKLKIVDGLFFQLILGVTVFVALLRLDNYWIHIPSTICYLLLLSIWDYAIWKGSPENRRPYIIKRHKKFHKCCTQLLFKVDGISFIIIVIWFISFSIFEIFDFLNYSELNFIFVSEAKELFSRYQCISNLINEVGDLFPHTIKTPLMGGIIGFHLLFTVGLLIFHLLEWEGKLNHINDN